ncbi:MAG: hypothetical protein ACLGHQ_12040 [Acidimicrobiia bacterium]
MTTDPVRAGAPSDNTTLTAVLAELERDGYEASFGARDGGRLQCSACREESPVVDFEVDTTRRLEGASDPDAQAIVVAASCPRCGARGTAVLGYGPEAAATDAEVVAGLDLS